MAIYVIFDDLCYFVCNPGFFFSQEELNDVFIRKYDLTVTVVYILGFGKLLVFVG